MTTSAHAAYPAPRVLAPMTAEIDYKNAGIVLTPDAHAAALAKTSAESAYGFCAEGEGACSTEASPTITLARATLPSSGSANADNSIKAAISNQLVYVVTWQGVTCRREGGPIPAPGAPSTIPATSVCTMIDLVDASTGKFLYGVQSTNP